MKEFTDESGSAWQAGVTEREGLDYKGRFVLVLRPAGGDATETVALTDVRWNSRETAARTLDTMSDVELRRRLRIARGRAGTPSRP